MSNTFHDINYPIFSMSKEDKPKVKKRITGVDESIPLNEDDAEPEVRIISAEWIPGPHGFQYNKQCFLDVKAEFLKETLRTRIRGKLFGIYNGKEEDLLHETVGFINRTTNIARMEIKYLFFINDEHGDIWYDDRSTPAEYLVKGIYHTLGENKIDSPVLKMPQPNKITLAINILETEDLKDSRGDKCILTSSDDNGESYSQEVSLDEESEQLVRGDNNILTVLFNDVETYKKYSCLIEINESNVGTGYKRNFFYNKVIDEQYAYTEES